MKIGERAKRNLRGALLWALSLTLAWSLLPTRLTPAEAYTADNPSGSTLESFPAAGGGDPMMQENGGTIQTLYANGQIFVNRGTIRESGGTVNENFGTVQQVLSGNVGTNYGRIEDVTNTGTVTVNDENGVVVLNRATVVRNYGTVEGNAGKVGIYAGGTLTENYPAGEVVFEGTGAYGHVEKNAGKLSVNGTNPEKSITVASNTGEIRITDGSVTVTDNTGTIVLGENAVLHLTNNFGTVISESESTAACSIQYDYRKIVFSGDDGRGTVEECPAVLAGTSYTYPGGEILVVLPADCRCENDGARLVIPEMNLWHVPTRFDAGDPEFTVLCSKEADGSEDDLDGSLSPDGKSASAGRWGIIVLAAAAGAAVLAGLCVFFVKRKKR